MPLLLDALSVSRAGLKSSCCSPRTRTNPKENGFEGGAQNKLVPLADGVRMNGAIFNSRLLAYPDLGHLPMEEAPAKTAAEGRAFVNGLTAN